jgi:hypothetical protein
MLELEKNSIPMKIKGRSLESMIFIACISVTIMALLSGNYCVNLRLHPLVLTE